MRVCFAIAVVISLSASVALAKKRKTRLAVLDIQVTNVAKNLVPILTEVLTVEVDRLGLHEVIANQDINSMLDLERQQALLDCDDSACMSEIAGALGVDKLLAGSVAKLGETFVVNIKLIDVRRARVEGRVYETVQGNDDVLIGTIRQSVADLIRQADGGGDKDAGKAIAAAPQGPTTSLESSDSGGSSLLLPIILWVAGAGAAAGGVVWGLNAQSHADEAGSGTQRQAQQEIDDGRSSQLFASFAFGAGGLLVAGGALLWLLRPNAEDGTEVGAVPGPGAGVSLLAHF